MNEIETEAQLNPDYLSEDDYHNLLDSVDPFLFENLSQYTDDFGYKQYLDSLFQDSKEVLDHYGRRDFDENSCREVAKLFARLFAFQETYEDRLETNWDLVESINKIIDLLPDEFSEHILSYELEKAPEVISMHKYLYKAKQYAENINLTFEREIKDTPVEDVNFIKSHELECILCVLNGVFSEDNIWDEEDLNNDPMLSLTYQTKDKLTEINNKIKENARNGRKINTIVE